jgi:hypothetical protein
MSVGSDFIINPNGDIRHISTKLTDVHTLLDFYFWLDGLADRSTDEYPQRGLDITCRPAALRVTNEIIELMDYSDEGGPRWNLDEVAASYLMFGTIKQGDEFLMLRADH